MNRTTEKIDEKAKYENWDLEYRRKVDGLIWKVDGLIPYEVFTRRWPFSGKILYIRDTNVLTYLKKVREIGWMHQEMPEMSEEQIAFLKLKV